MEKLTFSIDYDSIGQRIDIYLAGKANGKSRSFIQKLIDEKMVLVNNSIKKSNYKLKENDIIKVTVPDPVELKIQKENIPLDILYEDSDVIVVNKPQGMVVHPANGNYTGTLVNALLYHCSELSGINGVKRPGIVHRIDKDTSGILVAAKNDNAHNKLALQLKNHTMKRIYWALAEGVIKNDSGTIDECIGRSSSQKIKMAVVENGKHAVTHYKVLERYADNTLIECRLETGRTHQIRVHMAYIGHPLAGDPVYGYKKQRFNLEGQMLVAKVLGFVHPSTGKFMEFSVDLPDYFKRVITVLKNELK